VPVIHPHRVQRQGFAEVQWRILQVRLSFVIARESHRTVLESKAVQLVGRLSFLAQKT